MRYNRIRSGHCLILNRRWTKADVSEFSSAAATFLWSSRLTRKWGWTLWRRSIAWFGTSGRPRLPPTSWRLCNCTRAEHVSAMDYRRGVAPFQEGGASTWYRSQGRRVEEIAGSRL